MLYEFTIDVEIADAEGNFKKKKERYITDDELFASVEQKGLKLYDNECDVVAIKRSKVEEILNTRQSDKEHLYNAKLIQTYLDENTGKEKEQEHQVLFFAENLKKATEYILDYSKPYEMEVKSINKTNILEVI